jgi:hypothetical protein
MKSYQPLLLFNSDTKDILQGMFRSGDAYTSNNFKPFIKKFHAHIPSNSRLNLKADCGFFSGEILSSLEGKKDKYLIKAKGITSKLKTLLKWKHISADPFYDFERDKDIGYCECNSFTYRCTDWENERSFIVLRKYTGEKTFEKNKRGDIQFLLFPEKIYEHSSCVLNENLSPLETFHKYNERATCETLIDQAKNQSALGKIRTNDFTVNEIFFQICILAYNTLVWMSLETKDKELISWEIKTIRAKLIYKAGKLITGGNQYKILVPSGCFLSQRQWKLWIGFT